MQCWAAVRDVLYYSMLLDQQCPWCLVVPMASKLLAASIAGCSNLDASRQFECYNVLCDMLAAVKIYT
jgi:hypothetical protein